MTEVLFNHPGTIDGGSAEIRSTNGNYIGHCEDEIRLIRDDSGTIELWINGCLVYSDGHPTI